MLKVRGLKTFFGIIHDCVNMGMNHQTGIVNAVIIVFFSALSKLVSVMTHYYFYNLL